MPSDATRLPSESNIIFRMKASKYKEAVYSHVYDPYKNKRIFVTRKNLLKCNAINC